MKHHLSETCRLFLSGKSATVVIRRSGRLMAGAWFIITFGVIVFLLALALREGIQAMIFMMLIAFSMIAGGFWVFGYTQESILDMEYRTMIQRAQVFHWHLYTKRFSWTEQCTFKYTIHYDSYGDVFAITLIAVPDPDKRATVRMIYFSDSEAFFKFQKLFNKKFPEHTIKEWYD